MKPFYVAIEGLDGVGKSAVARRVFELEPDTQLTYLVKEPAEGCDCYEEIQAHLTGKNKLSKLSLAFMFSANRHSLRNELEAADRNFALVISDRSLVSSMVYQKSKHFKMKDIARLNQRCIPNLVILLQSDPQTRLQRISARDDDGRIVDLEERNQEKFIKACGILQKLYGTPFEIVSNDNPLEETAIYVSLLIQRYSALPDAMASNSVSNVL